MTLVDGVYSLLPGHRMVISEGSPPTVRTESYWDFTKTAEKKTEGAPMNRRLAAASVRALLEKTVESHLIADVPVGVFLSSGIDSTTLAALAAQRTASLHTVTVVFQEQEFNEAELARRTAQRLGTQHQELPLSGADMLERLGEAVDAFDQPSMDGINSYFVSWAARQAGLKVALSGLGGDELFGGYSTFQATPRAKSVAALARRVPASLRSLSAAAFEKVCGNSNRKDAHRKIAALWRDPNHLPHPYFYTRLLFTPEQVSSLLSPNAAKPSIAGGTRASATSSNGAGAVEPWQEWLERIARESEHLDGFAAVSCLESRSYLVNTLLRDTDSMSMAHSLEVRVPFLDHTLVEFVAQLPRAIKSGNGVPKSLLVEAMGNLLPADVVSQRKRTFTLPWEHWLRGPLKGQVESELTALAPPLATHLDSRAITKVWTSFLQGNTSWSRVWSLFVLSKWARRHLGCTSDDQPVTADSQQEAAVRIT
jgi:asparagine synthase (glutamine-hydrolysing)